MKKIIFFIALIMASFITGHVNAQTSNLPDGWVREKARLKEGMNKVPLQTGLGRMEVVIRGGKVSSWVVFNRAGKAFPLSNTTRPTSDGPEDPSDICHCGFAPGIMAHLSYNGDFFETCGPCVPGPHDPGPGKPEWIELDFAYCTKNCKGIDW